MADDKSGRELTPREPAEVEATESPLPPVDGENRDVERFSAGPRAHSAGLTEERSAQIVRQSANARNVLFLAILLIALFIPVYWFYESGVPALGAEGRLARETRRLYGDEPADVGPIANPGTPDSPRLIRLSLDNALQILDEDGEVLAALAVKDGETIGFEIENTAGFPHNFYIGTADGLARNETTGLPGVPAWSAGSRTFDWVAAVDGPLRFACTIPGHYTPMNGRIAPAS